MKKYALYILVAVAYTLRFLTGNLYGVVILLAGSYFLLEPMFGITPLTPLELLAIIDFFDMDQKALLLSSSLTVLGFLVAFSVATKTWKEQTSSI